MLVWACFDLFSVEPFLGYENLTYHLNILGEVVGRTINVRTHLSYKLKNDA